MRLRPNSASLIGRWLGALSIAWTSVLLHWTIRGALSGPLGGLWRCRVGNSRVICDIQDGVLRVLVVKIGDRREVYR